MVTGVYTVYNIHKTVKILRSDSRILNNLSSDYLGTINR